MIHCGTERQAISVRKNCLVLEGILARDMEADFLPDGCTPSLVSFRYLFKSHLPGDISPGPTVTLPISLFPAFFFFLSLGYITLHQALPLVHYLSLALGCDFPKTGSFWSFTIFSAVSAVLVHSRCSVDSFFVERTNILKSEVHNLYTLNERMETAVLQHNECWRISVWVRVNYRSPCVHFNGIWWCSILKGHDLGA